MGEDAVALWQLVNLWRRFPHLYEIKRPKGAEDMLHIADSFLPYLQGRDWQSVQNPAP
jgi:hypothetical protein